MKRWADSHPNTMCLWWVVISLVVGLAFASYLDHRRWGYAAAAAIETSSNFARVKHWYRLTGDGR